jgi:hypothetical protein
VRPTLKWRVSEVNRKWSLSGVRNENGGFGLDGRYHKDF